MPLDGYSHRKQITIDNAYVDSDLSDFTIPVIISADGDIGAVCRADGFDVRFTSSDEETELSFERRTFNVSGGDATGVFWVKVPTIATASDTVIWCYYGNSGASDVSSGANAFDANTAFVAHFDETSWSGSAGEVKEAKAANNGVRGGNATTSGPGANGNYGTFDGSGDYTLHAATGVTAAGAKTLSAWVEAVADTNNTARLINQTNTSNSFNLFAYWGDSGANNWRIGGAPTGSVASNGAAHGVATDLAITTRYRVCMTWSGTGAPLFYINGAVQTTITPTSFSLVSFGGSTGVSIGGRTDASYFQGLIDEPRIDSVERSAAWEKFSYRSQLDQNQLTIGAEEEMGGGGGGGGLLLALRRRRAA